MTDSMIANLRSDKITSRASGRRSCFELIKSDASGENFVTKGYWIEILDAAMDGAGKETENSAKKSKAPLIEVAELMRGLISHIVHGVVYIPLRKYCMVVEDALEILSSAAFSMPYKDEYRHVLCDILEPKISHSLSLDQIFDILEYMKEFAFLSSRNSTEHFSFLKLLKCFCKALFMDSCRIPKLLKDLLTWFTETLIPLSQDSSLSQAVMTATIVTMADCCSTLLQYQGLNCSTIFFTYSRKILSAVLRQLADNQFMDSQREPYLRFILMCIKYSTSLDMGERNLAGDNVFGRKSTPPLSTLDPLYNSLQFICDALTTDDSLRALVVYARQGQGRDCFVFALNDCKVQCNLQVAAMAVVLHQQQHAHSRKKQNKNKNLNRNENESQKRNKKECKNNQDTEEKNNDGMTYDVPNATSSSVPISSSADASNVRNNINSKRSRSEFNNNQNNSLGTFSLQNIPSYSIGYADVILNRIKMCNQNKKKPSNSNSQSGRYDNNTNTNTISKPLASATLEGLMILVSVITKLYPNGEFLESKNVPENIDLRNENKKDKNSENKSVNENKKRNFSCHICDFDFLTSKLFHWIEVVSSKLTDIISINSEYQLQGSIILALDGLACVTTCLIAYSKQQQQQENEENEENEFLGGKTGGFLNIWTKLIKILLTNSNIILQLQSGKKNSMAECAYKLLRTLIVNELIEIPSILFVLNAVLNLRGVRNPFLIESPSFLNLISAIILKSEINTIESVCAEILPDKKFIMESTNPSSSSNLKSKNVINLGNSDDEQENENLNINKNKNILDSLPSVYAKNNQNKYWNLVQGPDRGSIYIVNYLDHQLQLVGTRMSVQIGKDVAVAFSRILFSSFFSMSGNSDGIEKGILDILINSYCNGSDNKSK